MKYSIGFIMGFFTGKGSLPLASDGDETTLTLTKGDDFRAWLTDETRIKVFDGPVGEVPAWVKNRQKVHELVDAWLDGVEFDG
jgi:hypothetical protein